MDQFGQQLLLGSGLHPMFLEFGGLGNCSDGSGLSTGPNLESVPRVVFIGDPLHELNSKTHSMQKSGRT